MKRIKPGSHANSEDPKIEKTKNWEMYPGPLRLSAALTCITALGTGRMKRKKK